MLRVVLDPVTDTPHVTALFLDQKDTLHGPPFVSPAGYGFFIRHGQTDEVLHLLALPPLPQPRDVDQTLLP
jgi:hypothetical protein